MRPLTGYNNAKASSDFERLPAGGYVIRITAVHDNDEEDKQYLRIVYDIAEGPQKDRYKNETADNDYRHAFIRSYKEKALGMFKAFIKAIDETNGTNFDSRIEKGFPEHELVGKFLGVVFGYEEYEANDGNIKERLYVAKVTTDKKIRENDFTVPELKKLKPKAKNAIPEGFTALADEDLPF